MPIRKAVATSFFEDRYNLERLKSTIPKDWLWICIDGKYKNYNSTNIISYDGSREVIEDRCNTILEDCAGQTEDVKRQVYLNRATAEGIDLLVIIDSDEYFNECQFDKVEEELYTKGIDESWNLPEVLSLKLFEYKLDMKLPVSRPRILWKPEQMKYYNGHHYQIVDKRNRLFNPNKTIYSLRLYHDPDSLRSQKRVDMHDAYIKWLSEYEKERTSKESEKEKHIRELAIQYGY